MSKLRGNWTVLVMLATSVWVCGNWGLAHASPGTAFLALSSAPSSGDFDVVAYCTNPAGFAGSAAEYPDGWSAAYRSATPPTGWVRPFVIRGGGPASAAGRLHPQFSYAVNEMLPVRSSGVMALLKATDPDACYPGKPNPQPFYRGGFLFVHDGVIDIEPITTTVWLNDQDPNWDTFKLLYPRDYNGNGESTRGNASEIYFLALLYEIQATPEDIPAAFFRTLSIMRGVSGYADYQYNAVLQNTEGTWALRHVLRDQGDAYRIFYGLTTEGEYCITNHQPAQGTGWLEVPNFTLGFFPVGGAPQFVSMLSSSAGDGIETSHDGAGGGDRGGAAVPQLLQLDSVHSPACGELALSYRTPLGYDGFLQIWDLSGRLLTQLSVQAGSGVIRWEPPAQVGSGLLLTRLSWGDAEQHCRVLYLR